MTEISLVTYYQEPPSLAASNGPLSLFFFFYKPSPLAEGGVKGRWSAKAILRVSLTGKGRGWVSGSAAPGGREGVPAHFSTHVKGAGAAVRSQGSPAWLPRAFPSCLYCLWPTPVPEGRLRVRTHFTARGEEVLPV